MPLIQSPHLSTKWSEERGSVHTLPYRSQTSVKTLRDAFRGGRRGARDGSVRIFARSGRGALGLELRNGCVLLTPREAGACRDEAPQYDILLEAPEPVNRGAERSVDENLGRLLEGCGREEGAARQSALFDAEHYLLALGRELAGFVGLSERLRIFPILSH